MRLTHRIHSSDESFTKLRCKPRRKRMIVKVKETSTRNLNKASEQVNYSSTKHLILILIVTHNL